MSGPVYARGEAKAVRRTGCAALQTIKYRLHSDRGVSQRFMKPNSKFAKNNNKGFRFTDPLRLSPIARSGLGEPAPRSPVLRWRRWRCIARRCAAALGSAVALNHNTRTRGIYSYSTHDGDRTRTRKTMGKTKVSEPVLYVLIPRRRLGSTAPQWLRRVPPRAQSGGAPRARGRGSR